MNKERPLDLFFIIMDIRIEDYSKCQSWIPEVSNEGSFGFPSGYRNYKTLKENPNGTRI